MQVGQDYSWKDRLLTIADTPEEEQSIIFGEGFGVITDIKVGPDGYLYILGFDGTIYQIR